MLESFDEMGLRAEEMVGVAMRALAERDLAAAESLVELDELIDRANRRLVRHVLAVGGDETKREWGLRMIVISRCLERFGDHTVDIGEQVGVPRSPASSASSRTRRTTAPTRPVP